MNRTRFYGIVELDEVEQIDHMDNGLAELKIVHQPFYYRVTEADLTRPDVISYKMYGTVDLWWAILLVNNIQDVFNDLKVGTLLTIPNVIDLYDIFKKERKR